MYYKTVSVVMAAMEVQGGRSVRRETRRRKSLKTRHVSVPLTVWPRLDRRHAVCATLLQRTCNLYTSNWYREFVGKNTSFSLDEHYSAFIDGEIAAGRYRSASDVVRSALRLLEDRETQLRALRDALETGESSGTSTSFDFDDFLDRKRAEVSRGR